MTERLIKPDCTGINPVIEHELAAVSNFFSRACVPGKWAPDDNTDQLFSESRIKIKGVQTRHLIQIFGDDRTEIPELVFGLS